MALSGTSDLYIVELVIYVLLFHLTIYLGFRHGSAGVLGYFYLNATCAVRIAADIVSLLPANRDAAYPTISTAILSSIGLSPLLLSFGGFLHEAHVRLVEFTQPSTQLKITKRWLWVIQFKIHGLSILGIVLVIVGSVKLVTAETNSTTDQIHTGKTLRSVGVVLLLVLWVSLTLYALYLVYVSQHVRRSSSGVINLQKMVTWICLGLPFAGLRCIFSVVYAFDRRDPRLNPVTGALWVKVVFVFLASLGAVICLCKSGWVSRGIRGATDTRRSESPHKESFDNIHVRKN